MVDGHSAGPGFDRAVAALLRRRFGWSSPTPDDWARIEGRLRRAPRGVWAVCGRCPCGAPQVIANAPLVQATTSVLGGKGLLPTLFWLCCPELNAAIGRLESSGGIQVAHAWLDGSPGRRTALAAAHRRTAALRSRLVPQSWLAALAAAAPGPYQVLTRSGVGGIRGQGVKCLHAHVADHLALGDNPVGRWALAAAAWQGCACRS